MFVWRQEIVAPYIDIALILLNFLAFGTIGFIHYICKSFSTLKAACGYEGCCMFSLFVMNRLSLYFVLYFPTSE